MLKTRSDHMPRVRARKSGDISVTLPARLADRLRVKEGGYVDVQEVKDGILLKALAPDERRKAALAGVHAVQARVKPSAKMKRLSPEAQEDAIAVMLGDESDD
jgi:bifunctional DNA-binding transcriptional regulator/antitoxin component of YhaV-PrlF toxin-antitoxin module